MVGEGIGRQAAISTNDGNGNAAVMGGLAGVVLAAGALVGWLAVDSGGGPPGSGPSPAVSSAPAGLVRAALDRVPCSALRVDAEGEAGLTIVGALGEAGGAEARLRAQIQAAVSAAASPPAPPLTPTLKIEAVSPVMCAPLDLAGRWRRGNPELVPPLAVLATTPGATYRSGQNLILEVRGPGGPALLESYLQVDYFTLEGYVVHLLTGGQEQSPRLAAGQTRRLGDAVGGGRFWTVTPPFGREVIVAFASAEPLFATPRPAAEPAAGYLAELRRALDAAASAGSALPVAEALVITTVAN